MVPPRPPRDRQRGNTLLIALIVLSALATLGSLTVVSVQSSLKTSTNDRAQTIAMYAAESGAAVAMDYLKGRFKDSLNGRSMESDAWTKLVKPSNQEVASVPTTEIPSNDALPGDPNNLFTKEQNAWFDIQLLNNRDDPGYQEGKDQDGRIIIRSTGHGPQGSLVILEWEVQRLPQTTGSWDNVPSTQPLILRGWHIVSL